MCIASGKDDISMVGCALEKICPTAEGSLAAAPAMRSIPCTPGPPVHTRMSDDAVRLGVISASRDTVYLVVKPVPRRDTVYLFYLALRSVSRDMAFFGPGFVFDES